MGKVQSVKRRADAVLEEVFRALFEEIDTEKIRGDVAELKKSIPSFSPSQQARALTRRTAIRCAAAGAVTGIPIGGIAIGALGADLAYLVYQQFRLILGIATIYGHEPSSRERFTETLSCLAISSGLGLGKHGIATVVGSRVFRDRLTRFIPFVGSISGGALNYMSVYAVGRSAIRYYESRVDPVDAEEIWADGDREHA
jgi:hypothetical protein